MDFANMDLCTVPAVAPPPGVMPNFVDPVDQKTELIAVTVIMSTLSTLFLGCRLFVNWNKIKAADYWTFVGFVTSTAYTGVALASLKYSRHQWDIPACWLVEPTAEYMKLSFALSFLFAIAQFCVKAPILVLYLQLFSINRPIRFAILGGLVFAALTATVSIVLCFVNLVPRPGDSWMDLVTNGQAEDFAKWTPGLGTCFVLLDVYIFFIPVLILRDLKLQMKKKIQVAAVFLTALAGVICSGICLKYRFEMIDDDDRTWIITHTQVLSIVEHNVALIVASMPALSALLRGHKPGWSGSFFRSMQSKLSGKSSSSGSSVLPSFAKIESEASLVKPGSRGGGGHKMSSLRIKSQTKTTIQGPVPGRESGFPKETSELEGAGVYVVRTVGVNHH